MFLFKKKSATSDTEFEYHLHTGDFRADKEMLAHPRLQSIGISQLFLDTTYCDSSYAFPSQQAVINFAVRTSLQFLEVYPDGFIVVGTYTIGKERLFCAIAEMLDCKICVMREKQAILKCFDDVSLQQRLTLVKHEARVHVVAINQVNRSSLMSYLDSLRPQFNHVLAFEPTGWTYSNKMLSVDNIRPRCSTEHVTIYGVPYSEHSSYDELKAFVQFTRPARIIPTVNNGSAQSRKKMADLFNAWLAAPKNTQQVSQVTG